jgi:hypothetical protein
MDKPGFTKMADLFFCGVLFALGVVVCGASIRMGYGGVTQPGPGFLPFWCGALTALISFGLILRGLWKKDHPKKSADWVSPRPLIVLGAMVLCGFLLRPLGFPLAIFLFLLILFRFLWNKSWPFILGVSLFIDLVFYFTLVAIRVQLPRGLLGF